MLRLAVVFVAAALAAAQQCAENEEYRTCGTACPPTCAQRRPVVCTLQCVIGCQCKAGFLRDDLTGKCVREDQCSVQECGENAYFTQCGTACPPKCSDRHPLMCTKQCVVGCQCQPGFVLDDMTKKCVKEEQCSVQECPKNARFNECGSMCPRKCSARGPVPCPLVCVPGCECRAGLLREDATGECVEERDCQQQECDRRTEVYDRCSKACEKTCADPERKVCPAICWPGCVCAEGLVRHPSGRCVKLQDCPAKPADTCPGPNEEFKECGPLGDATCSRPVPMFSLRCRRGCSCARGFYRNPDGKCVTSDECGDEKKCLREQLERMDGPTRVGRFTPACTPDGAYEARQCHPSTGFCWCVDAAGREVAGTRRGPTEERVQC